MCDINSFTSTIYRLVECYRSIKMIRIIAVQMLVQDIMLKGLHDGIRDYIDTTCYYN